MNVRRAAAVLIFDAGLAAVGNLAACSNPDGVSHLVVDSVVVSSESVAPAEGRTYEYDFAEVRPDSVLRALWTDGFAPEVAWRPLHYLCEDPRGPRLTVQLAAPEPDMARHHFSLGTGRLRCSTDLMQYVVSALPG
jgi:hypothetical protein